MAAHGDFHSCPPPAILLSSCGPSRSTRVWGERATRRDLLSPCPVQASMIAHFLARSRLHGKRHFLERGERTWTAVPSATRGSGETGPLLLCKFAEGYRCRCDEVMCCEVMEWQRTSLARNRNADRVGIHFS